MSFLRAKAIRSIAVPPMALLSDGHIKIPNVE